MQRNLPTDVEKSQFYPHQADFFIRKCTNGLKYNISSELFVMEDSRHRIRSKTRINRRIQNQQQKKFSSPTVLTKEGHSVSDHWRE